MQFQYSTFRIISQHRFYFECTLSTFVPIAIANQSFSYRKDTLSPSAKKTSFSRFHLLDVSPFSALLSLYLAAFRPQFCSPSLHFLTTFACNIYTYFFIISPDHLSDVPLFTNVISSFYGILPFLIFPVIHQSYIPKNHRIYVVYTKSHRQQSPYP